MKYVYEIFDDIYGDSIGMFGSYHAAAVEIAKRILQEASSRQAELDNGTLSAVNIRYEVKQHEVKE